MGSKISVFVIVIAMVILAGVLGDSSEMIEKDDIKKNEPQTYEETEQLKEKPREFLFENYPTAEEKIHRSSLKS